MRESFQVMRGSGDRTRLMARVSFFLMTTNPPQTTAIRGCVRIYTLKHLYRTPSLRKINAVTTTHEIMGSADALLPPVAGLRLGIDIVQISAIEASLAAFGEHFMRRIFTPGEVAYATEAPALAAQRLAARFAAKEAAIKAFGLSEAGIGWRDVEVRKLVDGQCSLALHRKAAAAAARSGCTQITVSLSHDGDYATAVVAALSPR